MQTVTITRKQLAIKLLRRYDKLRRELREIEHETNAAAAAYGKELGYSGFTKDMLRNRLAQEQETKRA